MIEALAEARGHRPRHAVRRAGRPAPPRSILHGTGDAWFAVAAPSEAAGSRRSSFQYKGLFPAIDEAVARLASSIGSKLEHLVDEVPCAACTGSRLRDDAAAVRFRDRTLDQIGELAARPDARVLQGAEADRSDEQQIAGDLLREIREPAASSSSTSGSIT